MTGTDRAGVSQKRVFIHVGLQKTGSSALQAFFTKNAKQLAHMGVSYPSPEAEAIVTSGVCTGNVLHVMQRKAARDGFEGSLQALADRYLCSTLEEAISAAAQPTVLLSGEFISGHMTPDIVAQLQDLSCRHHITILCLVRDPYDLAVSAWKQNVKTGKETLPLSDRVKRYCAKGSGSLGSKKLLPLLASGVDVRVRNYDCIRNDLVSAFLSEIGLQPSAFDWQSERRHNLSLSYWQATAVVMAQKITGSSRFSARLLEIFRTTPGIHPDPYLPSIDAELLAAQRPVIDHLNHILPPEELLRHTLRSTEGQDDQSMPLDVVEQLLLTVREELESKTRFAVASVSAHPSLPADFDPVEYLIRNPDVAAANMDPVYHYINHGRFEGRVYKAGRGANPS